MYERQKLVPVRNITYSDAGAMGALALVGLGFLRRSPLALAGAYLVYKATRKPPREIIRNNIVPFLTASGEIKKSAHIICAPDEVFAHITNLELLDAIFPAANETAVHGTQQARIALGLPLNKELPFFLTLKNVTEPRVADLEIAVGTKTLGTCTVEIQDDPIGEGTVVQMVAHTKPVMGVVGRNVIKPFITFAIDTYLFRLKQLCETGEIARTKGE